MIRRMTVTLGVFLFCVGATAAQPADEPAPASQQGPLSSFLPKADNRFWFSADYLFAVVRGSFLPPLVTTSDAGTPRGTAGVFGAAGSSTLFGDRFVNDGLRSGMRLGA